MVKAVEDILGPVTVLVNNAGIAEQHQFQDITPEYWKRIFDVNLGGAFNTIQAVLPHMIGKHTGTVWKLFRTIKAYGECSIVTAARRRWRRSF